MSTLLPKIFLNGPNRYYIHQMKTFREYVILEQGPLPNISAPAGIPGGGPPAGLPLPPGGVPPMGAPMGGAPPMPPPMGGPEMGGAPPGQQPPMELKPLDVWGAIEKVLGIKKQAGQKEEDMVKTDQPQQPPAQATPQQPSPTGTPPAGPHLLGTPGF